MFHPHLVLTEYCFQLKDTPVSDLLIYWFNQSGGLLSWRLVRLGIFDLDCDWRSLRLGVIVTGVLDRSDVGGAQEPGARADLAARGSGEWVPYWDWSRERVCSLPHPTETVLSSPFLPNGWGDSHQLCGRQFWNQKQLSYLSCSHSDGCFRFPFTTRPSTAAWISTPLLSTWV